MQDKGYTALPSGDPAGPLHTEREIRYRPYTARVYGCLLYGVRAERSPGAKHPRNG